LTQERPVGRVHKQVGEKKGEQGKKGGGGKEGGTRASPLKLWVLKGVALKGIEEDMSGRVRPQLQHPKK